MSYPSTAPRSHQIDVIDQISRAYRVVVDNLQLVVEIALLPYLIVLGIDLVAFLIPGSGLFGRLLAGLVHAIGFLVFGSVFVVRWHRFVLLGERVGGGLIPAGWVDFVMTGIKLGVLIFAGWVVLLLLALVPPQALTAPLAAVGGFALALAALRVSLVFPAAAVQRPVGLRTAWNWIEGNFWRLLASAIGCYLPFIVVQAVVGAVAPAFPSLIWIVFEAVRLAVSFAGSAVAAAMLAHLYRDITGGPEAAP
ncbi:MAG: hypothetical protein JO258_04045 [Alphaproteobacteria bacterium]|nr:hypothetical protein [Alphaproteobacteria bacterium]